MSQYQFDATKVPPAGDRTALPPDTYSVLVQHSEIKTGKVASDRQGLFMLKVIDGPLSGQMIPFNLNLIHSNPVAQQIAQERMSALCHAVGVLQITDTAQLHGRPFKVKTSVREDDQKKKYTEIDAFLKADGSAIGGSAPAASAPPAWAGGPPAPAPAGPPPPAGFQPPAAPPAPAPAPPPVVEKKFYVAKGGQIITQQAIPQSQVMAQFGADLMSIQILEDGTNVWVPGGNLALQQTQAPATPTPVGAPPWMTQPPPSA